MGQTAIALPDTLTLSDLRGMFEIGGLDSRCPLHQRAKLMEWGWLSGCSKTAIAAIAVCLTKGVPTHPSSKPVFNLVMGIWTNQFGEAAKFAISPSLTA